MKCSGKVESPSYYPDTLHVSSEGVSKIFWTGLLERELQMVQLSAIRCSCIAVFWVSLVSFAAITLCVASQRVFIVVYFVIDSVRKLLDTPLWIGRWWERGGQTKKLIMSVSLLPNVENELLLFETLNLKPCKRCSDCRKLFIWKERSCSSTGLCF
jgi:hypothetical protein